MTTPRIRSINLNKYSKVAQELGIDPLRLLRQVGLDHGYLNSPDLQVPETAFAQLLEASASQSGDASVGLLIGSCWRLSDFGPISLLLQHQISLASMLAVLKDYHYLLSSTITTETVTQGRLSIVQLHLNTERETPGRHPMELGISALLCLCRHQMGKDWNPMGVHFTHGAPGSTAQHRRLLGCEVVFGSDFDGIVLTTEDLRRPDPEYDSGMEEHARALIGQLAPGLGSRPVEQQVRNALQSLLPHGRHSIAQIAGALGCTSRSLQRQLESSQTCFQDLLDTVRSEAAVRALKNPRLSISETAALTGFAEISSFTRWFSKRFHQSPSHWRQQQQQ